MHEWSLAQAVIYTVIKHKEKEKLKQITEIEIKMGELQQIDKEIFKFALQEIAQLEKMEGIKIKTKTERAVLKCRVCEYKWDYNDSLKGLKEDKAELIHFIPEVAHVYLRCSQCKSPDFEVIKGRGVWINYIKGL